MWPRSRARGPRLPAAALVALLALGAAACEEPAELEDDAPEDGVEEEDDGLY